MNFGCQEPIFIGGELLEDQKIQIETIDDISLSAALESSNRFISRSPNESARTFYLGQLNDPTFGKLSSELYLNFRLTPASTPNYSLSKKTQLDSLVLILEFDTLNNFGLRKDLQDITVELVSESWNNSDTIYSDYTTPISRLIAERKQIVAPFDSVKIINHLDGKTQSLIPQLRIKIDPEFAEVLIKDTLASLSDVTLSTLLKGVKIKSTSVGGNEFMYAINALGSFNRLTMFYTQNDTTKLQYSYLVNATGFNTYVRDYSNSLIEDHLANPVKTENLAFIQGLGGVKTKVNFSGINRLKDYIINKAELVLTTNIGVTNIGTSSFPSLVALTKNADNTFTFIEDIQLLLNANQNFNTPFGGNPRINSSNEVQYKLNITNHLKKEIANQKNDTEIFLQVVGESSNNRRLSFYGPKSDTSPLKLIVTVTKNQ